MVDCVCRGDIVAVLPRLNLVAVDVVMMRAAAKARPLHRLHRTVAEQGGWTVAGAE